jgi:glutathione peroxidase
MSMSRRTVGYAITSALTTVFGFLRSSTPLLAQSKYTAPNASMGSAHVFSFEGLKGDKLKLSDYRGKVVMIVNTASFCGFSNQFKDLQALYKRFADKGFIIIGVPSNDFGSQEPGSADEIAAFCSKEYGVDFPMTAKQVVKGESAHPFYKWAAKQKPNDTPRWNFFKYLLDKNGHIVGAFGTTVSPLNNSILSAIEVSLAAE